MTRPCSRADPNVPLARCAVRAAALHRNTRKSEAGDTRTSTGQKARTVFAKSMSEAGPLKSRANGVAPLVDKLASFEELRHFMAHGTVEVALKQSGEPIYVFSMIGALSDGLTGCTLTLTRPEAQSRTARLADIAQSLGIEALRDNGW